LSVDADVESLPDDCDDGSLAAAEVDDADDELLSVLSVDAAGDDVPLSGSPRGWVVNLAVGRA
jgi:hypothetical protein